MSCHRSDGEGRPHVGEGHGGREARRRWRKADSHDGLEARWKLRKGGRPRLDVVEIPAGGHSDVLENAEAECGHGAAEWKR